MPSGRDWRSAAGRGILPGAARGVMQKSVPKVMPILLPMRRRRSGAVRLVVLLGFGLALGACSKCDVPDFTHWGSSAPHTCDSDAPQR